MMSFLKRMHKSNIEREIQKDPRIGEDTLSDHNSIVLLMISGHMIKITEIILIIFNISFFVGIFFLMVADLSHTFIDIEN